MIQKKGQWEPCNKRNQVSKLPEAPEKACKKMQWYPEERDNGPEDNSQKGKQVIHIDSSFISFI